MSFPALKLELTPSQHQLSEPKRTRSGLSLGPVLFLVFVALLPRLILTLTQPAVLWPDSIAYYRWAASLAGLDSTYHHPPFRTPGYPAFLSVFLHLGESTAVGSLIVFAQHLLGVVAVLCWLFVFQQVFSQRIALIAACLISINPLQLYYEQVIQTEVLFTTLLALLFVVYASLLRKYSLFRLLAFVFVGALLTLTRPIGQLLVPLLAVSLLVCQSPISRALPRTVLSITLFLALLSPWVLLNFQSRGVLGVSREVGINLFHRVIDADQAMLDRSPRFRLIRGLTEGYQQRYQTVYFYVYHALRRDGFSEIEADREMYDFARAALDQDRIGYVGRTLQIVFEFFFRARNSVQFCDGIAQDLSCSGHSDQILLPAFSVMPIFDSAEVREVTGVTFTVLRYLIRCSYFLFPIGVVLGFQAGETNRDLRAVLLFVVLYFAVITAIFIPAEDRFRLPIDGVISAFTVFGIARGMALFRCRFGLHREVWRI